MENTLRYWMWGYQRHFVHHLQYEAAEVLAAIGLGKVATRGLAVGVLSRGETDPNPVCVSPEEGLPNLDEWRGLPALVEDTFRKHPGQMMGYGDAPSMADKPETLFRDSVRMAVLDFIAPRFASEGMATFVGTAAPVGKFHVAPVVGVDEAILNSEFVLAEPVRFERWSSPQSLAHAALEELLREATAELLRKDPGRDLGGRGLERAELVRRAGEQFMHAPGLALQDILGTLGFFRTINEISSLLYEQEQSRGSLTLGRAADPGLKFDLRFAAAIPLRNARWSRKVLQMGTRELSLLADANGVLGLGSRVEPDRQTGAPSFEIEFLGQHRWWLKADGRPLMRCDFGVPTVPRRNFTPEDFATNFRRVFQGSTAEDAARATALFDEVGRLDHGCMLVFAEDAATEAQRLAGQGTPTVPLPMTPTILRRVSGIDGTVVLDPSSVCHAVGVILDGPAHELCDPSRGSRYNSAVRWVHAELSGRMAIVGSDDGMVDVLPILRPIIYRSRLLEQVAALEAATSANYHKAKTWLREHAFYLDAELCRKVNLALKRIAAEPLEPGLLRIIERPFTPHPDLNGSYFIDGLPNQAAGPTKESTP